MIRKESRSKIRAKKHYKLRNRINGTSERPRLSVFRSNDHMYAQIIDDTVGNTLVSASTTQKDVKAELEKPGRDPRQHIETFSFDPTVHTIDDLHEGQLLPGIVTNIDCIRYCK